MQSGDYPLKVASDFGISLDALVAANGWGSADDFPTPNTVIQIPSPAAAEDAVEVATDNVDESAQVDDTSDVDESAEVDETSDVDESSETVATSGNECSAREYAIEAGDTSRLAVANKFDVTVDALDAANAATNGYNAFYPGLLIVIPAGSDC